MGKSRSEITRNAAAISTTVLGVVLWRRLADYGCIDISPGPICSPSITGPGSLSLIVSVCVSGTVCLVAAFLTIIVRQRRGRLEDTEARQVEAG
jgi:hypothetical protein